jgi:hypothetical protein
MLTTTGIHLFPCTYPSLSFAAAADNLLRQPVSADRPTFSIPELLSLNPGLGDSRKYTKINLPGLPDLPLRSTSLGKHRRTNSLEGRLKPASITSQPSSRRESSFHADATADDLEGEKMNGVSGRAAGIAKARGLSIAAIRSTTAGSQSVSSPGLSTGRASISKHGDLLSPGPQTASSFRSLAEEVKAIPRSDSELFSSFNV